MYIAILSQKFYLVSYDCIRCRFGPKHVHTFTHFCYLNVVK